MKEISDNVLGEIRASIRGGTPRAIGTVEMGGMLARLDRLDRERREALEHAAVAKENVAKLREALEQLVDACAPTVDSEPPGAPAPDGAPWTTAIALLGR